MANADAGSNTALDSIDITEGQFPVDTSKQPSEHTSDSDKNRSSEEDIQSVIRTHEQRMRAAEIVPFESRNHHLHLAYEMAEHARDECEFAAHIRGMMCKELGDLTGAMMWFEKACSLNRTSSEHHIYVGRVHFLQGQHKVADEMFLKAIELNPKCWKAYYWKAMAVYHLDSDSVRNTEKAQEILRACPDMKKYADIVGFSAKLATQAGKVYDAIDDYKIVQTAALVVILGQNELSFCHSKPIDHLADKGKRPL
uniref:TPR_REGION domain-containing protein n=1 Tax=Steinernema glaseri TaxID=37863 RepID=A0A1I7Y5R2_9BILA